MSDWITKYEIMPIPPVEEQTTFFDVADGVRVGVEYRLLTDAIADAQTFEAATGNDSGAYDGLDDRGVSLHVFADQDGESREFLRFDCFNEDPHYHYVSEKKKSNEMVHIDPIAIGDPLAWAIECIRTRLPQMLERAGNPEAAKRVDPKTVEEALPRLVSHAYSARYGQNEEEVLAGAMAAAGGR